MMAFAKVTDRYSSEQIERYYATGVWRRATLFDELEAQVAIRPDKVFITDGNHRLHVQPAPDRGPAPGRRPGRAGNRRR